MCGVFLLPYFLQKEGIKAIPLSALAGIAIALVVTLGFFYASSKLQNKVWIAVITSMHLEGVRELHTHTRIRNKFGKYYTFGPPSPDAANGVRLARLVWDPRSARSSS